jgi:hypothetical protein
MTSKNKISCKKCKSKKTREILETVHWVEPKCGICSTEIIFVECYICGHEENMGKEIDWYFGGQREKRILEDNLTLE